VVLQVALEDLAGLVARSPAEEDDLARHSQREIVLHATLEPVLHDVTDHFWRL